MTGVFSQGGSFSGAIISGSGSLVKTNAVVNSAGVNTAGASSSIRKRQQHNNFFETSSGSLSRKNVRAMASGGGSNQTSNRQLLIMPATISSSQVSFAKNHHTRKGPETQPRQASTSSQPMAPENHEQAQSSTTP